MKRLYTCILLLISFLCLQAQDFYISFQPKTNADPIDTVWVTNQSTDQKVRLSGNESLLRINSVTEVSASPLIKGTGYLYPNPGEGDGTLVFSTATKGQIRATIYNASGQLLSQITMNLSPGLHRFFVQFPLAGVYFLAVFRSEGTLSLKAVSTGNKLQESSIRYLESIQSESGINSEQLKSTASKPNVTIPKVRTNGITGITQSTATGGGQVTQDGGATVTSRGVCWSTSLNPTISNSKTTDGTGTGIFTSNITGLTAATTYFVRAYATNSQGTAYGSQITFTTSLILSLPTVTTNSITNITQTTATGGGNVISEGIASVTARGICWSTTSTPIITDSKTTDGSGTGTFTSNMTGLTAGTTYYVRAYATNSQGIAYGSQVTFTTSLILSLPTVTTNSITNITQTTATGGGNVTSEGIASVTARGVCWSTLGSPTTADSKTTDGSGTGSFTSSLSGLASGILYYVRAYATNSQGTAYGSQVSFTTLTNGGNTVTDIDGNVYPTVTIGTQVWMAENLKTTTYLNGTAIPYVTDASAWSILTTGAYSWYNNNEANYKNRYGALYNWYAVVDSHNLCPSGWHVPSESDWSILETYMIANGYNYDGTTIGNKIAKSLASKTNWAKSTFMGSPGKNPSSNNSSGFNGIPAGGQGYNGTIIVDAYYGLWWSSTVHSATDGRGRMLYTEDEDFYSSHFDKRNGFSVRCLKD